MLEERISGVSLWREIDEVLNFEWIVAPLVVSGINYSYHETKNS